MSSKGRVATTRRPRAASPGRAGRRARRRRVAILGHVGRPAARRAAAGLRRLLSRRGCEVRIEQRLAAELGEKGEPLAKLASWCQILVSLGGDGTALEGARALAGKRAALLPVNFGGLGFLTIAESGELGDAVQAALQGRWPVARRSVVRAQVTRRGRPVRSGIAMNDAVLKSAGGYAALHLRLEALGHDLGHLVADGLIAATAAGSTAYSLSAGGPVLSPDLDALLVTPVCAHSLGSRALVLPPAEDLTVRVIGSLDRPVLLLDGQDRISLEPHDRVRIQLIRAAVRVFQNPGRPFTRALQGKLGWQGSARRSM